MTMPKQKSKNEQAGSSGHPKRQKTYTWQDSRVTLNEVDSNKTEIDRIHIYESRRDIPMTLDALEEELLQPKDQLEINFQKYALYKGFKIALRELLKKTISSGKSGDCKVLLIHGVYAVGKSTLAACLAYLLALTGRTACCVKMDNANDYDSDRAAEHLTFKFCTPDRWIIFDQCNVNAISQDRFMSNLCARDIQHPILMFTSGHYPPPAAWREDHRICFMPICINVDVDAVKQMMGMIDVPKSNIKPELLLKYTTVCGRAHKILNRARHASLQTEADIEYMIYQRPATDNKSILEFFLFLWPEFVQSTSEEVSQKPTDWELSSEKVEFMGLLLTSKTVPRDWGINSFFNWIAMSDQKSKSDGGYYELDVKTVFYSFPLVTKLYSKVIDTLRSAEPHEIYKSYENIYNTLSTLGLIDKPDTNSPSMRGQVFENKIRWFCRSKNCGILISGSQTNVVPVSVMATAHGPDELINQIEQNCTKRGLERMWFELNVKGHVQFPGFDFAYVEYFRDTDPKFRNFQLIGAAVNVANKTSNKPMMKTLIKMREKFGKEVTPYFMVPAGYHTVQTVSQKYTDPERNLDITEEVVVAIMEFK